MVDLVLLHGPPASGKLTVATEISALTGARVFHNHLTIDVAKSLFEFGAPGFWELVRELRMASFRAYFSHGMHPIVSTWCYEDPEDHEMYVEMKHIAEAGAGRVLPVFLQCNVQQLEARVANKDRLRLQKLTDVERLRTIVNTKNYAAIPDELCIEVDSQTRSPVTNAKHIVSHFSLQSTNLTTTGVHDQTR